jgi:hypothetical protein
MSAQNEEGNKSEGSPNQELLRDPEHNSEGSSTTQFLETMKKIIVELQMFNADNEKLKKA